MDDSHRLETIKTTILNNFESIRYLDENLKQTDEQIKGLLEQTKRNAHGLESLRGMIDEKEALFRELLNKRRVLEDLLLEKDAFITRSLGTLDRKKDKMNRLRDLLFGKVSQMESTKAELADFRMAIKEKVDHGSILQQKIAVARSNYEQVYESYKNEGDALSMKKLEIGEMRSRLDDKQHRLKTIEKQVLEKRQMVNDLENIIKKRDMRIVELNEQLDMVNREFDDLSMAIKDKEKEIKEHEAQRIELRSALEVREEKIEEIESYLKEKDEEISDMELKMEDIFKGTENLENDLEDKNHSIVNLRREVEEYRSELNTLSLVLSDREREILVHQDNLNAKENYITSLFEKLNKYGGIKEGFEEKITKLSKEKMQILDEAFTLQKDLDERDQIIEDIESEIITKIEEDKDEIHQLEKDILLLKAAVSEREETIRALQLKLTESIRASQEEQNKMDKDVYLLQKEVLKRENAIVGLESIIANLREQMEELYDNLTLKGGKLQEITALLKE